MLRLLLVTALALVVSGGALGTVGTGTASGHPSDSLVDQDHDSVNDPPFGPDNCAGEDAASNTAQTDTDGDGRGDACDIDDDGDAADDAVDNCPLLANQAQSDLDGDNAGDACDADDDGDGLADSRDNCRDVPNANQQDQDGDGMGDACEDGAPPTGQGAPPAAPLEMVLSVRPAHRTAELGAGLAVPVSCSTRCALRSTLRIGVSTARRLGVPRTLGAGRAALDGAGRTYVFVGLARRTLRRLGAARRLRATLRVEAAGADGTRLTATRRLTLRR